MLGNFNCLEYGGITVGRSVSFMEISEASVRCDTASD